MIADAFFRSPPPPPGALFFTAEHASNRVPRPYRPRPSDRRLLQLHWGYDIGIAMLFRKVVRLSNGGGVAARFSRLLIDPNREPSDQTAVLVTCDDGTPCFNRSVDLSRRVERFHAPFHAAIEESIRAWKPRFLCSLHSFTPSFRGKRREMEAGVLFDRHDDVAKRLMDAMNARGLVTAENAPYSGKDGLIYSAARHGAAFDLPYLEIEVRQDLLRNEAAADRVARRIVGSLRDAGI